MVENRDFFIPVLYFSCEITVSNIFALFLHNRATSLAYQVQQILQKILHILTAQARYRQTDGQTARRKDVQTVMRSQWRSAYYLALAESY